LVEGELDHVSTKPPTGLRLKPEPRVWTERAGFEPATHLSARTRFPVALLRPLGHLSKPAQGSRFAEMICAWLPSS
jgi:hypothetical protein